MRRFLLLIALVGLAGVALADSPGLPVTTTRGGATTSALSGTFLKIDASNDPLTGQLQVAAGTAATPALAWVTGGTTTGFFAPSAGNLQFSSAGVANVVFNSTEFRPATNGQLTLGNATIGWSRAFIGAGAAATPALTLANSTNTGLFGSSTAVDVAIAGGGEVEVNATSTNPLAAGGNQLGTAALPWGSLDVQAGAIATPSLRMGDTNSGVSGGADVVTISTGGTSAVVYDNTNATEARNVLPSVGTLNLGSTSNIWSTLFAGTVAGNNTTITLRPGTTATTAQGVVVNAANDDGTDAASLRINSTSAGGTAAIGATALSVTENGTAHTDLAKQDTTGTGIWNLRTGMLQISALTANSKGITPVALPICAAGLSGSFWYKEDTDTAATAPALCFCSRDNAALTYSWKLLSGTGTCT